MALNERMNKAGMATDPMVGAVAITGGAVTLSPTCRGVMVTTAGSLNAIFQDGSTANMNLPIGYFPFALRGTGSGSTAVGWLLL